MDTIKGYIQVNEENDPRPLILFAHKRSRLSGGFSLLFDDGNMILSQLDLTKHEYRIILFLLSIMEFKNYVYVTQIFIAESLRIKQPDVSKSLKSLEAYGLIFREKTNRGKAIRVSAVIGWRGQANSEFNQRFSADSEHILVDINC